MGLADRQTIGTLPLASRSHLPSREGQTQGDAYEDPRSVRGNVLCALWVERGADTVRHANRGNVNACTVLPPAYTGRAGVPAALQPVRGLDRRHITLYLLFITLRIIELLNCRRVVGILGY